jgi:hypothetical protein
MIAGKSRIKAISCRRDERPPLGKNDWLGSNGEARRRIGDEVHVELVVCLYGMTNIERTSNLREVAAVLA